MLYRLLMENSVFENMCNLPCNLHSIHKYRRQDFATVYSLLPSLIMTLKLQ